MGRRVILDSNILIDIERDREAHLSLNDADAVIAAVSVAELRTGAYRASDQSVSRDRIRRVSQLISQFDVLDYTAATAKHHANLLTATARDGKPRGAHDLIIAAHAIETGRVLISRDASARFGDLPEVLAEEP